MIGNPTRPGDLAVIIGGDINCGALVRVLDVVGVADRVTRALQPMRVWNDRTGQESMRPAGFVALAQDEFLQPIRPPGINDADEQASEREVTA